MKKFAYLCSFDNNKTLDIWRKTILECADQALYEAFYKNTIQSAWKTAGCWPVNRKAVLELPEVGVEPESYPALSTSVLICEHVLTSKDAMTILKEKADEKEAKQNAKTERIESRKQKKMEKERALQEKREKNPRKRQKVLRKQKDHPTRPSISPCTPLSSAPVCSSNNVRKVNALLSSRKILFPNSTRRKRESAKLVLSKRYFTAHLLRFLQLSLIDVIKQDQQE